MAKQQSELFDRSFETASAPNPIFCHQDFLEKLEANRSQAVGKRAALLMQRLAIDERRQHFKGTRGVNQGWRRSRLGGNQGSHFYAWWAPRSAAPLQRGEGFQAAPESAIFLRDIRHHDDHSEAHAQSFQGHYLPVSVAEMRGEEYGPAPWTIPQLRFASARQPVRLLKGHPGSGKTTALLHAADDSGAARVLYITYSSDLASLARAYFDRYCSRERVFHVVTYQRFLRELTGSNAPSASLDEARRRFRGDTVPFVRALGAWTDRAPALFDELHAHLVGAALPVKLSRFAECRGPRVPDENYRQRRVQFLGQPATAAALDLASRLERNDSRPLAERYFPELALAWQAASGLSGKVRLAGLERFLDFDCIAVDECQDLTALEAFVVAELGAVIGRKRRVPAIFLAGDEAQTVRPTDFEWGWMSDLLHYRVNTPAEFKLGANLRSPRAIAQLVNRVWDLYSEIGKRDRPGGTGYAEIADDATDQVLYCTAAPGDELNLLVEDLASREGLAMVAFDEGVPEMLSPAARGSVLTAAEVKGLDFHTVCVLNPGRHLEAILRWRDDYRMMSADIESIRRRLAIDELRVAVSRPAERLIWLDINPTAQTVETVLAFLNRESPQCPVSQSIPEAIRSALAEEQLAVEERVQRCESDARQYLSIKPEIAWSRAQQAVSLLGDAANAAAVTDEALRRSARLTLAEVCFCLAFRNVTLAPELGRPDLYSEAATAAAAAGRYGLAGIIRSIARVLRQDQSGRIVALGNLVQDLVRSREDVEPWLLTELGGKLDAWVSDLEAAVGIGNNAVTLSRILPPFYEAMRFPDAAARKRRLYDRAIRLLIKDKRHAEAFEILQGLAERRPADEAECLEEMGEPARAAELYRSLGKLKEALRCYRAIPDFDAAAALIGNIPDHPAGPSYQWLLEMRKLVAERPENFGRAMQPSEKKVLQQMLEEALGVARKRPAARKAAAPRKKAAKRG